MNGSNMHFIQKHILKTLCYREWARFRDLKPKNVDSNLYNYHLKLLIKDKLVEKVADKGYRLLPLGMRFIDHVSIKNLEPRWQPKLLTKLVCINEENEVLMWPKHKQPFIGRWSLPSGKVHYDDRSLESAMRREILYMTDEDPIELRHRGVIEFHASIDGTVVSHTIAHVFYGRLVGVKHALTSYVHYDELSQLNLSPGTMETIELVLADDSFFYNKYEFSEPIYSA